MMRSLLLLALILGVPALTCMLVVMLIKRDVELWVRSQWTAAGSVEVSIGQLGWTDANWMTVECSVLAMDAMTQTGTGSVHVAAVRYQARWNMSPWGEVTGALARPTPAPSR